MDSSHPAAELVIILILGIIILSPLVIIAVSKLCCNILTIYTECSWDKHRKKHNVSHSDSTSDSGISSIVNSEKLALIKNSSRLQQETGIKLENYPFTVDYSRPLVISSGYTAAKYRQQSGSSESLSESVISENNSQMLGSDSPASDLFSDQHLPSSPLDAADTDNFTYSPSPETESYPPAAPACTTDQHIADMDHHSSDHGAETAISVHSDDSTTENANPNEITYSNSDNDTYGGHI